MRSCFGVLAVVLFSGVASANGIVERGTDWAWAERPEGSQLIRGLPSPRERTYAEALATALGSRADAPARIGQFFSPGHDLSKRVSARGVRVSLDDGTQVERLMFDSEQDAFDYALYGAEFGAGKDVLVEARGRQVVVVRGADLEDPKRAGLVLDAAWGGGIPTPKEAPSVSATFIDGGGMVLVSRRSDPILDAEFKDSFDQTRERVEDGEPGYRRLGEGDHYGFDLSNGWNGLMQERDGVRSVVTAASAEQRKNLDGHLARATRAAKAAAKKAAARGGAGKRLSDAFRD